MIPARFVVEYPERCRELLEVLEPIARQRELLGSFSLLVAAAMFTIPYERLKAKHPLAREDREQPFYEALRRVEGQKFLKAEFWTAPTADEWRFSRIMTRPGSTYGWKDEDGVHPMRPDARNTIAKRTANDVLRVIRNALAHGNIIYLDENGQEQHGARLRYLAFLSRYEETDGQRAASETYRLVTSTEDGFVVFVKAWASWLESLPPDDRLLFVPEAA